MNTPTAADLMAKANAMRDENMRASLERAQKALEGRDYLGVVLALVNVIDSAATAHGSKQFADGQESATRIYRPELAA